MKLRRIFAVIICLNLMLMAVTAIMAQDDGKLEPIDHYPLPASPGSVAYTLADRWDHTDLTYFFHNCPRSIDCDAAHNAVRAGFAIWAQVSALTFNEVATAGAADIEIRWTTTEENLGSPGGVLAFAYFPSYGGDIYFDDAERWTLFDGGETDMFVVAAHEIGHSLGMDHSDDPTAVMYAYAGAASNLNADDIAGIQQLYGVNAGDDAIVVVRNLPENLPDGDTTNTGTGTTNAIETAEGVISNTNYYDAWTIDVEAGETIEFTLEATSGNLDTYIAIFTPNYESVLAEDDDGFNGTNSQLVYTFDTAGEYIVVVTRYNSIDGATLGDYRLTATRFGVNANPPTTDTGSTSGVDVPTGAANVDVTFVNISGVSLCVVYISPTTDDYWGNNALQSGQQLGTNGRMTWTVPAGIYDLRVEDCGTGYLEQYYIVIEGDTIVGVMQDRFVVEPAN